MWQAPSQRVRAAAAEKKRQRDRQRRPIHFKRVTAEIREIAAPGAQATPKSVTARVVLNDLSPRGIGLFSCNSLLVGTEVALTLDEPRRIYLRGRIVWCQEFMAESHVISQQPFSFRMGIKFTFESAEEEAAVKKFCDELVAGLQSGPQAA